jgi:prepilin-type N-terminal cleavage/methylation domain-containing protein
MSRSGFTLVEVLTTVTLTAVVVLLLGAVYGAVVRGMEAIERRGVRHNEEAIARRWVEEVIGGMEVGGPDSLRFEGSPRLMEFHAWSWSSAGWLERRPARLAASDSGLTLEIGGVGIRSASPAFASRRVRFAYLDPARERTAWMGRWMSSFLAPVAVRIVLDPDDGSPADTLLIPAGGRR